MRVLASAARTETIYDGENFDAALTRETTDQALTDAAIEPVDLDIVELHDAFTVEELLYAEAISLSEPARAELRRCRSSRGTRSSPTPPARKARLATQMLDVAARLPAAR